MQHFSELEVWQKSHTLVLISEISEIARMLCALRCKVEAGPD
jgi:hypothetical protein